MISQRSPINPAGFSKKKFCFSFSFFLKNFVIFRIFNCKWMGEGLTSILGIYVTLYNLCASEMCYFQIFTQNLYIVLLKIYIYIIKPEKFLQNWKSSFYINLNTPLKSQFHWCINKFKFPGFQKWTLSFKCFLLPVLQVL